MPLFRIIKIQNDSIRNDPYSILVRGVHGFSVETSMLVTMIGSGIETSYLVTYSDDGSYARINYSETLKTGVLDILGKSVIH